MIPTIRAKAPLLERVSSLVKLTRKNGTYWGCCPFHSEKTASFMVDPSDQHFHCFSCGAHGDVIDWTMRTEKISKGKAIKLLAGELGIEQSAPPETKRKENPAVPNALDLRYRYHDATVQLRTCLSEIARIERQVQTGITQGELGERRSEHDELVIVLRELHSELYPMADCVTPAVWGQAQPLDNTLGQVYLQSRGISITAPDLRYCKTWNAELKEYLPSMVAAIRNYAGEITGLHRTYLGIDGNKAKVEKVKKMLGRCSGGAVRLGEAGNVLAVTEGIETGLSVQQETGLPIWAALSAPGMASLVVPPPPVGMEIVIYADHDQSGVGAAKKLKVRMESEGRNVQVKLPPEGLDFNDLLMRGEWIAE